MLVINKLLNKDVGAPLNIWTPRTYISFHNVCSHGLDKVS